MSDQIDKMSDVNEDITSIHNTAVTHQTLPACLGYGAHGWVQTVGVIPSITQITN